MNVNRLSELFEDESDKKENKPNECFVHEFHEEENQEGYKEHVEEIFYRIETNTLFPKEAKNASIIEKDLKRNNKEESSSIVSNYYAMASNDILFDHFSKRGAYVLYSDMLMLRAKSIIGLNMVLEMCKRYPDQQRTQMILHKMKTDPKVARQIFYKAYHATTDSLRTHGKIQKMSSDIMEEIEDDVTDIHDMYTGMSRGHAVAFSVTLIEWILVMGMSWTLFKQIMFPDSFSMMSLMSEFRSKTNSKHMKNCSKCSTFINYLYLAHTIPDPFAIFHIISDPVKMNESQETAMKEYLDAPEQFNLYEEEEEE